MDLPMYYGWRDAETKDCVLSEMVSEAKRLWTCSVDSPLPTSDWSNDWSRFDALADWILPISRWGYSDPHFAPRLGCAMTITIRSRLPILGDIIPIAYRTDEHETVVFRVGDRLYFCTKNVEDGHDIAAIPLTPQELLQPASLAALADGAILSNDLSQRCEDRGAQMISFVNSTMRSIVKYVDAFPDEVEVKNPEEWTKDDWDTRYQKARVYYRDRQL